MSFPVPDFALEGGLRLVTASLNHLLEQNSWAGARLGKHIGKILLIRAGTLPPLSLSVKAGGRFGTYTPEHGGGTPDVEVAFAMHLLPSLLTDTQAAMQHASINGVAGFAEDVAFIFKHIQWHPEDDLSALIGDVPAQRLGHVLRQGAQGIKRGLGRLGSNWEEHLGYEAELLVQQGSFHQFCASIQEANDDLLALERRVGLLS